MSHFIVKPSAKRSAKQVDKLNSAYAIPKCRHNRDVYLRAVFLTGKGQPHLVAYSLILGHIWRLFSSSLRSALCSLSSSVQPFRNLMQNAHYPLWMVQSSMDRSHILFTSVHGTLRSMSGSIVLIFGSITNVQAASGQDHLCWVSVLTG